MDYDLAIIGAGWAGFNAGLRAKVLGLKTLLIDKDQIGGTCLNLGCIPTKTLIQSAKVYSLSKKAQIFGIEIADPQINFSRIQERKNLLIQQLQGGMRLMLKGVDFINGQAEILSPEELKVGTQTIRAKFILIATGAKPMELANFRFDGKKIISSNELLNLKEIPKSLLIIGGGVIGCEFASLFSILGSEVSVVEKMPQLLPGEDKEVAKKLETNFKKKGIKVNTNTDATTLKIDDDDLVLVCIGRIAQTSDLGLDKLNIKLEKEKLVVDEYLRTSMANIYAAGDCIGKIMLAHYAAYQGRIVAQNIADPKHPKQANNLHVPNCIFTEPEIASIGLSEEKAKARGIEIRVSKFYFLGSGMAHILDETDGFMKIISDQKTEQVIGASIIGPRATELIGILTLGISTHLKTSQIQDVIFAHPTLSESITDALKETYGTQDI